MKTSITLLSSLALQAFTVLSPSLASANEVCFSRDYAAEKGRTYTVKTYSGGAQTEAEYRASLKERRILSAKAYYQTGEGEFANAMRFEVVLGDSKGSGSTSYQIEFYGTPNASPLGRHAADGDGGEILVSERGKSLKHRYRFEVKDLWMKGFEIATLGGTTERPETQEELELDDSIVIPNDIFLLDETACE